jgi:hypothetical protein
LDGTFFTKYKNLYYPDNNFIASWLPIQDSLILGKIASATGKEENKILIFNKKGVIKTHFKNYIKFNRVKPLASHYEEYANIYKFKNVIYFKEIFNDTLFRLTDQFQLIPEYTITFGRFEKPLSEREIVTLEAIRNYKSHMWLENVFQTSNYLFLDCFFSNQFPAKRITPRVVYQDITLMYNTQNVLGIFDKKIQKLIFCKPTSTDNPLFTSGIYNDIDAGPRFFPKKMVNDSTMVMWIDAKQLKDHVASDDFKNNEPKYPEKKKKLEDLANSLTEFDNAVLMFVTFKKK